MADDDDDDVYDPKCQWFLGCHADAAGIVEHPTLGDVNICQAHLDWLTDDFSPTKMVPPMAAAIARRRGLEGVL